MIEIQEQGRYVMVDIEEQRFFDSLLKKLKYNYKKSTRAYTKHVFYEQYSVWAVIRNDFTNDIFDYNEVEFIVGVQELVGKGIPDERKLRLALRDEIEKKLSVLCILTRTEAIAIESSFKFASERSLENTILKMETIFSNVKQKLTPNTRRKRV